MPTKNSIIVHVTPKDIRSGQTCASKTCPVARAFARAFARHFPKIKLVDWGIGDYYARIDFTRFIFPTRVSSWIENFDCGRPVRPFRFTINMKK